MNIAYVSPQNIDAHWATLAPLIDLSVKRRIDYIGLDDVYSDLRNGRSVAWLVIDGKKARAAIVTTVVQYPKAKALRIDHIGGSRMAEWIDSALGTLKEYAGHMGVTRLEADGRKGFDKYAGRLGFNPAHTHYEATI